MNKNKTYRLHFTFLVYYIAKDYGEYYTGASKEVIIAEQPVYLTCIKSGNPQIKRIKVQTMNGRVYDPLLGRFLSPDNYVQMPDFSQNFNRYAYCFNNPLVYTDPDGEFVIIAIAVGAVVGAYIGGAAAEGWQWNPTKWEWDADTWKGVGAGFVFGGIAGAGFYFAAPALSSALGGTLGTDMLAYSLTGMVLGGGAGYLSGYVGGYIYSDGNKEYAKESGSLGMLVGSTIGSTLGMLEAIRRNFKDFKAPELPDIEMPTAPPIEQTEVPSFRTPVYRGSYLEFSGELSSNSCGQYVDGTLTWIDVYSDGSTICGQSLQGRSGPFGYRVIPRGLHTLREGRYGSPVPRSSYTYGGVSFFIDTHPNRSMEIHPDGNNRGTKGCIGIRESATDLNRFYNSVTRYLTTFQIMLLNVEY